MPLCSQITQEQQSRRQDAPRRICFVCTGNTCRSPMAAAVANAMEAKRAGDLSRLIATSAGLYAQQGAPITSEAVSALERMGVPVTKGADYHAHTAHSLTDAEAADADVLVAMSRSHAMGLLLRFPEAASKIVCMPKEISDPFGGDLARYEDCLAEIVEGVRALLFAGEEA